MKTISKTAFTIFCFIVFIGMGAVVTSTYGQSCSKTPDQIVDSVYAAFDKYKGLAEQKSFINIQYTNYDENGNNGAIRIHGIVESKGDHDKVIELAGEASCVTRVNSQGFSYPKPVGFTRGGCDPPTTIACGDICIPGNETCNIGRTKSGNE